MWLSSCSCATILGVLHLFVIAVQLSVFSRCKSPSAFCVGVLHLFALFVFVLIFVCIYCISVVVCVFVVSICGCCASLGAVVCFSLQTWAVTPAGALWPPLAPQWGCSVIHGYPVSRTRIEGKQAEIINIFFLAPPHHLSTLALLQCWKQIISFWHWHVAIFGSFLLLCGVQFQLSRCHLSSPPLTSQSEVHSKVFVLIRLPPSYCWHVSYKGRWNRVGEWWAELCVGAFLDDCLNTIFLPHLCYTGVCLDMPKEKKTNKKHILRDLSCSLGVYKPCLTHHDIFW